jgi:hypothetical protein
MRQTTGENQQHYQALQPVGEGEKTGNTSSRILSVIVPAISNTSVLILKT